MKNKNGTYIIGVDHGYGNIKTANCCFPTGVVSSDTEPTFKQDLLVYEGKYYQIGIGHKEYDLHADLAKTEAELERLRTIRTKLQNQIRRADPKRKEELRQDKAEITAQITELRKRRKMAINIEERSTHIDTMMTHR